MPKFLGDFSAVEISNGFNDPVKALAVCAAAAKSKRYTAFMKEEKRKIRNDEESTSSSAPCFSSCFQTETRALLLERQFAAVGLQEQENKEEVESC